MAKILPVFLVLTFAALVTAPFSPAQSTECGPQETAALLQPADPAYDDAIELARTLSEHRLTIKCVLASTLGGLFDGLEGAALYRTSDGDFDVLFQPKPKTFVDLKIIERPVKKGFVYSFAGTPRHVPANRLGSVRRQYFLKHENHMIILSDESLKTKLEDVLHLH